MVDFTTPNLCGANTDFNSLINKFVDIEKILTGNLNIDASALSGLLSPELTDLLTKVRGLAPAAPTLPNISLQSQIGDLLDIDKSTVAGIGKYLALAAVIATYFDDELTVAGYSLTDIISKAGITSAAGGNICAVIPNFELPAAGGTAVEKAAGVLQADVAPEIEKPSVLNKNVSVTNAQTELETKAKEWVNPDDKVIPTADTGAYTVTTNSTSVAYGNTTTLKAPDKRAKGEPVNKSESVTKEVTTPKDAVELSGTVVERKNISEKGHSTRVVFLIEFFKEADIRSRPADAGALKVADGLWAPWGVDRDICDLKHPPIISQVLGYDATLEVDEEDHPGGFGGFRSIYNWDILRGEEYEGRETEGLTGEQIFQQLMLGIYDVCQVNADSEKDKKSPSGPNTATIVPANFKYSPAPTTYSQPAAHGAVYVVKYKYLDPYDPNYKK